MKKLVIVFLVICQFSLQAQKSYEVIHFSAESTTTGFMEPSREMGLDSLIVSMLGMIHADSLRQNIESLENFGTRFMLAPNRKQVAMWLKNRFEHFGIFEVAIDSFQTHTVNFIHNVSYDTTTWQYNVVATLQGNSNPNKTLIVSGHYDSFSNDDPMIYAPGADDDGSGVASVLEIARVFSASGFQPNCTVKLVAFAAEELMYSSTLSGASHYATTNILPDEQVAFFISNDMIANSTLNSGWRFNLNNHDPNNWITRMGMEVSTRYTSLTPLNVDLGAYGGDDQPFYSRGIPAFMIAENEFSPNYHSNTDLVENCNMNYCAEVTKACVAVLLYGSETPTPPQHYFLKNPGNGTSLLPSWDAGVENDIVVYRVYVGRNSQQYDTYYETADTSFLLTGLHTDSVYFVAVAAINRDGNQSAAIEKHDSPVEVDLDQGVLIVEDSKGGFLNPSNEDIHAFYDTLCTSFTHTSLDAKLLEEVSLDMLGNYSSVLWHIDNYDWNSPALAKSQNAIRNYLDLGGHMLLTSFLPGKMLDADISYPATFFRGDFMYDVAHVTLEENNPGTWFSGAYPMDGNLDSVYVDTTRIFGPEFCIPYVSALLPAENGQSIYLFDTNFDTTSFQGSYHGKSVGVENKDDDKNFVVISFPLYYTNPGQAKMLVDKVMHDKFGEFYIGIGENTDPKRPTVHVFPNPATTKIYVSVRDFESDRWVLSLYDLLGKEIESKLPEKYQVEKGPISFDVADLPAGVYFVRVRSHKQSVICKVLKH